MRNRNRTLSLNKHIDPQTAAMNAANDSARRVGEEAAARHQKALDEAAQHRSNVVQVMTDPNAANLSQRQINTLVRATPAALAKALREISR